MRDLTVERLARAMWNSTEGKDGVPPWDELLPGDDVLREEFRTYARAAIACLQSTPPEAFIPEGWKLVPIEPTGDMIDAGGETPKMKIIDGYCSLAQLRGAFTEDRLAGPKSDCAIAQAYKAMLATAPAWRSPLATSTPPLTHWYCQDCDEFVRERCHLCALPQSGSQ